MTAEMGEYLVGAYLELIEECDVVSYNIRFPETGIKGLGELDVMGLNFKSKTAFLCEVVTHLSGLLYSKGREETTKRIFKKFDNQKSYARKYLRDFKAIRFQLWSPIVRKSLVYDLGKKKGLELIMNQQYTHCINQLIERAKPSTKQTGNPAFRMLQIITHMRKEKK